MTIDPKTLTSEERAIWDAEVSHVGKAFPFTSWRERYDAAWLSVAPQVLARRALFSPAQPEPKREECPDCFEAIPCGCDEVDWEPAPSPAPVAGELAHEVKAAWAELKSASALSRRDGWFESSACQDKAADDLKSWARSQATAQPVAVGMSEELKVVLEMADFGAMKLLERGFDNTKERKAILAVRAQAASAQPGRDLPKVRELIGWFKADCRPYKSAKESSALRDAALAELDAQPKAVEVPVEAIRRYVNGDAQIEDEKKVVRWIAQVEEGE